MRPLSLSTLAKGIKHHFVSSCVLVSMESVSVIPLLDDMLKQTFLNYWKDTLCFHFSRLSVYLSVRGLYVSLWLFSCLFFHWTELAFFHSQTKLLVTLFTLWMWNFGSIGTYDTMKWTLLKSCESFDFNRSMKWDWWLVVIDIHACISKQNCFPSLWHDNFFPKCSFNFPIEGK